MSKFLGEFECKLDNKGRFILPAALKKQVPQEAEDRFVLKRGFEKCLVLYPRTEWEKIAEEVDKLNSYVQENRDFLRYFHRGAHELQLDGAFRLLIPKKLMEYANIDKDIVLFAHSNKIEIWDQDTYDDLLNKEPENFSALAEKVMGGKNNDDKQ